jgi:hypothetical protein
MTTAQPTACYSAVEGAQAVASATAKLHHHRRHDLGVGLRSANLAGVNLEGAMLQDVDLSGADIRGARFDHAKMRKDVRFEDVVFDEETSFELAEGLRPLSRLPAFQNYTYDRGIFRRRSARQTCQTGPNKSV